jgi:hypothetical protein
MKQKTLALILSFVFGCVNVYAGQCQSARRECYNAKLQAWQAGADEWRGDFP